MRKTYLNICLFFPLIFAINHEPITSRVYDWQQPAKINKEVSSTVLFEGSAFDMEWLQMNANSLMPSKKKVKITVPQNEEHLYIIKKGTLNVRLKDSSVLLPAGSVLVVIPGENFSISNLQTEACDYYTMKYRSKLPTDKERAKNTGGSIVSNWNQISYKPHDKGGRRDFFERATAMMKRLEIHVSTLNPGLKSHEPHTHKAEEIVLMMEGTTEMQIGEKFFKGKEGSIFFLGSNIPHAIRNEGITPSTYFAIQFE
jgi:(S)-ureidoglycine aminohydrolase